MFGFAATLFSVSAILQQDSALNVTFFDDSHAPLVNIHATGNYDIDISNSNMSKGASIDLKDASFFTKDTFFGHCKLYAKNSTFLQYGFTNCSELQYFTIKYDTPGHISMTADLLNYGKILLEDGFMWIDAPVTIRGTILLDRGKFISTVGTTEVERGASLTIDSAELFVNADFYASGNVSILNQKSQRNSRMTLNCSTNVSGTLVLEINAHLTLSRAAAIPCGLNVAGSLFVGGKASLRIISNASISELSINFIL